jgi:hypothetical protein
MSDGREILIEIARIGSALDVRAVDASDGLEVSFVAAAGTPMPELEALAARKLAYVRARRHGSGGGGARGGDGRGGVLA